MAIQYNPVTNAITNDGTGATSVDGLNLRGLTQVIPADAVYEFVLTDAGKQILHPAAHTTARTWTIPANSAVVFPIGTVITIINQASAGVLTIAITTDALNWYPSAGTGARTLAASGMASLQKITATVWVITGCGLT